MKKTETKADIAKERDAFLAALERVQKIIKPLGMARDINHYMNRERTAMEVINAVLTDRRRQK